MQVYQSLDFIKYCGSFKTDTQDLMNDTALVILSMNKDKRNKIEQDGYMLRYAQRTARNIFNNQKNKIDLVEYKHHLRTEMLPDCKLPNIFHLIKNDITNPDNSIPAKMLIYAVEHGSAQSFAKHMGVPYRGIQKIIKAYKDNIKKRIK